MTEKITWIKIAESVAEIPFGDNRLAEVTAEGKRLCLARIEGAVYAVAPKCPHAGGLLVYGVLDGKGNVVCPLHRYKFCVKNGRNVSGEGYYLKHWPVEVREDGVYVGLSSSSLFSF